MTSYMKILILLTILTAAASAFSQEEALTIGAIDFYGRDSVNVDLIRAALPLREGDQFSRGSKERIGRRVRKAIRKATGLEVSDVAPVCCDDRGRLMVYIGLRGKSVGQ